MGFVIKGEAFVMVGPGLEVAVDTITGAAFGLIINSLVE